MYYVYSWRKFDATINYNRLWEKKISLFPWSVSVSTTILLYDRNSLINLVDKVVNAWTIPRLKQPAILINVQIVCQFQFVSKKKHNRFSISILSSFVFFSLFVPENFQDCNFIVCLPSFVWCDIWEILVMIAKLLSSFVTYISHL